MTPTTGRVVCNNTLTVALDGSSQVIRVPHNTSFDADAVKCQLGIAIGQWDDFMYRMKALAERKIKNSEVYAVEACLIARILDPRQKAT